MIQSHVLIYERRFVKPVQRGDKLHTIRPPRKREILPGDLLRFRYWEGKPYRSPQVEFAAASCHAVRSIRLEQTEHRGAIWRTIEISGVQQTADYMERLAIRDGFCFVEEMFDWHRENYGLGRDLLLIEWKEEAIGLKD